jgi:hypothetical protein
MSELSGLTLTWRGLTFYGGDTGRFTIATLDGWEGLPDPREEFDDRPQAHGSFDAPPMSGPRRVIVSGLCASSVERDTMLIELGATMTFADPDSRVEDLTIDYAGRILTAGARLNRYKPFTSGLWASGAFGWKAEWVCPNPLRYGARVAASATFPVAVGGLRWPLYSDGAGANVGAMDYGPTSTTGRLTLANPGTATATIQHEVVGPVDSAGFEIIEINGLGRLVFAGAVPTATPLLLDGATGQVLLDGTSDRSTEMAVQDWPTVPKGGSVELFFRPMGSTSAATLTSSLAPPVW